ncbi:ferric iron reductase [Saccharibacillus sp. O16]|nr:ferric iron reductase [Saccharibacillus sp. O16]
MNPYLSTGTWQQLAQEHSITLGKPPHNSVRTLPLSELQNEATCLAYVSWFQTYIDAPDLQVAASMLAKRLGYLWTAPLVTAMTFHRQHVSLDLQDSFLYHPEPIDEGMTRFPFLAVNSLQAKPIAENRESQRAEAVKEIFALHLTPLLKILAKIAPLPMSILWENIMVRVGPLYQLEESEVELDRTQIQADFIYLTQEAPGEVFDQRKNPLTRFTICENEAWRARSERLTCCFYYRMSGEYCRKCPKIDTEKDSQLK